MNWKAWSTRPPPSQPELPATQSSSSCSDNETSDPVVILLMPSTAPVDENAHPLPHLPWSFTPVTAPRCRQSTRRGSLVLREYLEVESDVVRCSPSSEILELVVLLLNSSRLISANWFSPSRLLLLILASLLCFSMYLTLSLNIANRFSSSDGLLLLTPCVTAQESYNARNLSSDSRSTGS
ncbi:hypothetical protein Mapa_003189 [Marchantia paleacea]|nr:hypothetical protein Mapa_003189 [Marchantia paleacea]